ncbi:MAG TPA: hypothetical protein VFR02_09245, partial [bacterium]|nr:hypothetical protein [bacterium]
LPAAVSPRVGGSWGNQGRTAWGDGVAIERAAEDGGPTRRIVVSWLKETGVDQARGRINDARVNVKQSPLVV